MNTRFSPSPGSSPKLRAVGGGSTDERHAAANSHLAKEASGPIRVLLIDDHQMVGAGLRLLIESRPGFKVVGATDDLVEAVEIAGKVEPDIIVLDLTRGNAHGTDCIPTLLAASANSRILILAAKDDSDLHLRAMQQGAMGLVLKHKEPEVLFRALEKVNAGEAWLDRLSMGSILSQLSKPDGAAANGQEPAKAKDLTMREREVITLVAQGLRNKQIGDRLAISEITVRHHLTSIFRKLEVTDRFELIIYAYRHGLARPPE